MKTFFKIISMLFIICIMIFSCKKTDDKKGDETLKKKSENVTEIKFVNTIVFVKDLNVSKKFYGELLGLKVLKSYQTIVWFENNLALHNARSLHKTIYNEELPVPSPKQGHKNIDIYFETNNLEEIYNKLVENDVEFIHPIEKQQWGQKVIRFYDPDGHIVEIGEALHIDFSGESREIVF